MSKYESKKHYIKAFQFSKAHDEYPEWFDKSYVSGRVAIINNSSSTHITIYDKNGDFRRAYIGDWVCMDDSGEIFPLSDKSFQMKFKKADNAKR